MPAGGFDVEMLEEPRKILEFALFFWPFLFAGTFGAILIVIAIVRPKRIAFWLAPAPMMFLATLLVSVSLAIVVSNESFGEKVALAAMAVLPPASVLIWCAYAIRSRDMLLAATRAMCGLSILMPLTLYCFAAVSFVSRFLHGFYLAVAASVGLTIATWFLYTDGERVFSDKNMPRRKIRFRIRTLMIWTMIVAGISAFIQHTAT